MNRWYLHLPLGAELRQKKKLHRTFPEEDELLQNTTDHQVTQVG